MRNGNVATDIINFQNKVIKRFTVLIVLLVLLCFSSNIVWAHKYYEIKKTSCYTSHSNAIPINITERKVKGKMDEKE